MYSYNFVILPSGTTSAGPLPVAQHGVQGTSELIEDSAQEDTASVVDLSARSGTSHHPLPVPHPESEVITTTQYLMVPLPTAGISGLQQAALPASHHRRAVRIRVISIGSGAIRRRAGTALLSSPLSIILPPSRTFSGQCSLGIGESSPV